MAPFDTLIGLAEVETAFTGFSGVVAALAKDSDWTELKIYRFQNLLALSILTVFFSLMPLVLSFYELREQSLWISCNGALIAFSVGFYALRAPIAQRLITPDDRVGRGSGRTFQTILPVILVLQGLGIANIVSGEAAYLSGIYLVLFLAALQFCILALQGVRRTKAAI